MVILEVEVGTKEDGQEMVRSGTYFHGRDLVGFMDVVHAGMEHIQEQDQSLQQQHRESQILVDRKGMLEAQLKSIQERLGQIEKQLAELDSE